MKLVIITTLTIYLSPPSHSLSLSPVSYTHLDVYKRQVHCPNKVVSLKGNKQVSRVTPLEKGETSGIFIDGSWKPPLIVISTECYVDITLIIYGPAGCIGVAHPSR